MDKLAATLWQAERQVEMKEAEIVLLRTSWREEKATHAQSKEREQSLRFGAEAQAQRIQGLEADGLGRAVEHAQLQERELELEAEVTQHKQGIQELQVCG